MTSDDFTFDMGSLVRILFTEIAWQVIGRTEYAYSERAYTIRRIDPATGGVLVAEYPQSLLLPAGPRGKN